MTDEPVGADRDEKREAVIRAARAWHEFDAEELDRDLHEALALVGDAVALVVAALPEEETR